MLITPIQALGQLFFFDQLPNLPLRYNIAPSQKVAIVRLTEDRAARELVLVRWGLVPFWAKDLKIGAKMINARAETVQRLPAYREAYRRRRCLVPADGFYEWQKTDADKQPFLIRRRDRRPFAFAGLWERWRGPEHGERVESCTIVTTTANRTLAPIHPRMPVILAEADHHRWLAPDADLPPLLAPAPEAWLEAVPVSKWINRPANDDVRCIEPQASAAQPTRNDDGDHRQGRLL